MTHLNHRNTRRRSSKALLVTPTGQFTPNTATQRAVDRASSNVAPFAGPTLDTKYPTDYRTTGDHPTLRGTERIPTTYLFPSPSDPVHGYPMKPSSFIVAKGSSAKA